MLEVLKAAKMLEMFGIGCEVVDLPTLRPLDPAIEFIEASVSGTHHLLVVDDGSPLCGIASEIVSRTEITQWLEVPPMRITPPDVPLPASPTMGESYYPNPYGIAQSICELCGVGFPLKYAPVLPLDKPSPDFVGPF